MEKKNKISAKEKKMLYVLVSLIIAVISYQFGYVKYNKLTESVEDTIGSYKQQIIDLNNKQLNYDRYLTETETMTVSIDEIVNSYAVDLTVEEILLWMIQLEKEADMEISSISFNDPNAFYSGGSSTSEGSLADGGSNTSEGSVTEESSSTSESSDTVEANNSQADTIVKGTDFSTSSESLQFTAYERSLNISYKTTYDGLKKCIDFINKNEYNMNLSNVSAAFDSATGNLTGTITISLYAVQGMGRAYEDATIQGIVLGTDNIFGTFDLEESQGETTNDPDSQEEVSNEDTE